MRRNDLVNASPERRLMIFSACKVNLPSEDTIEVKNWFSRSFKAT